MTISRIPSERLILAADCFGTSIISTITFIDRLFFTTKTLQAKGEKNIYTIKILPHTIRTIIIVSAFSSRYIYIGTSLIKSILLSPITLFTSKEKIKIKRRKNLIKKFDNKTIERKTFLVIPNLKAKLEETKKLNLGLIKKCFFR